MNFVDVSIQLQVEVSEENPSPDSNIAPEERPNHPHVEQMRIILYTRPSGIAVGQQAAMVQGGLGKALEKTERHMPQEPAKGKKQFRRLALPDMQAGDLEDMGILVGEVYDERIVEKS